MEKKITLLWYYPERTKPMPTKFYNLKDSMTLAEMESTSYHKRDVKAVKTGEFRAPKKDEWYLSGAIPEAYKAKNDLDTPYHILRLVKVVKTKTKTTIVEDK